VGRPAGILLKRVLVSLHVLLPTTTELCHTGWCWPAMKRQQPHMAAPWIWHHCGEVFGLSLFAGLACSNGEGMHHPSRGSGLHPCALVDVASHWMPLVQVDLASPCLPLVQRVTPCGGTAWCVCVSGGVDPAAPTGREGNGRDRVLRGLCSIG
jgi:hypothetical protein